MCRYCGYSQSEVTWPVAGAVKLTGLVDMTLAPALRVAVTQGEPLVKLRPSSPALSATVSCSHALASHQPAQLTRHQRVVARDAEVVAVPGGDPRHAHPPRLADGELHAELRHHAAQPVPPVHQRGARRLVQHHGRGVGAADPAGQGAIIIRDGWL